MPTQDVFWPATRSDVHWGIWSGAALIALVTLGRAAANVLPQIHPAWVVFLAAGLLGCNLLTWWWSLPQSAAASARAQVARGAIAICPALVLGVVLAGVSSLALIGVLVSVACGLAFVIVQGRQRGNVSGSVSESSQVIASEPAIELPRAEPMGGAAPADGFSDASVQQQIIRRRTDSGDYLEALLRIEFAANQREVSIHLPIQPAFCSLPEVECEPLDDADVDLKVATVHAYGVRIDAKRSGRELEASTIAVGILLHSSAVSAAAA